MELKLSHVMLNQLARALDEHQADWGANDHRVTAYASKAGGTETLEHSREPCLLLRVESRGGTGYSIGSAVIHPHVSHAEYEVTLTFGWHRDVVTDFLSTLIKLGRP